MHNRSFHFLLLLSVIVLFPALVFSQDSAVTIEKKVITLKEVVVRNNLNVR